MLGAGALGALGGGAALAVLVDPLMPLALLGLALVAWVLLRPGSDTVTVLTVVVVMLFAIPNHLVIGALDSAGSPALLAGLGCLVLWGAGRLLPSFSAGHGLQPVRIAVLTFAAANLASYAAAQFRPVLFVETRAADRGLMMTLSMVGLAMLAADGIASRQRLDTLIRRLVVAGALLSAAGIATALFGIDPAALIRVPGLSALDGVESLIGTRSGFPRVRATTAHAIEFSVVLAMLLPFAIHLGFNATRRRRAWWAAAALIGAGVPLSLARSGVVGLVAVAIMLVPTMSRERRRAMLAGALAYVVAIRLIFPGVLGTLRALFTYAAADPSVTSRTEDYTYIGSFFAQAPVFGRGFATFIPTLYDFVDNQYLVTVVETGLVGLFALLGMLLCGMTVARGARGRSADPVTRDLGQALAAAVFVALLSSATFDFLGFGSARGLLFLLLGCAGALWRLEREAQQRQPEVPA